MCIGLSASGSTAKGLQAKKVRAGSAPGTACEKPAVLWHSGGKSCLSERQQHPRVGFAQPPRSGFRRDRVENASGKLVQQTSDERKPRGCLPSLCPPAQVGVKPLRTIPGGFSVAESKAGAFMEWDVPVRRSRRTPGRLHISGWGWPRSSVASRVLQKALSGQKGDFGWAWDEGSGLTAAPSPSPCPGRAGAGSQAPRAAARGAALRRPAGKAKVLLGFSEGRSRWPGPAASGMRTSWSLAVTWGRRGREGADAWQGDGA